MLCTNTCHNCHWYADHPVAGDTAKIDHRRPIEGEINRRQSIEGEKGKTKKKRKRRKKKKRRRSTSVPRIVLARAPSPPSLASDFSPTQGDRTSTRAGRKIEA
ncbi:hypothetical protein BHM03_00020336, partial [Ensete ventricosum]